jgi:D-3-phosphoglycerate dehydrogenase
LTLSKIYKGATMKILIADSMSGEAVEILKSNGLSVDVKTDLKKEELAAIIGEYDALIVRSATKVTREIIAKADKLRVIGRAGIGVDNVDVEAATEKGIVVMNTPQGNALAAAEHTIALMFAVARKIALADATMKQGKWEKKLLMGVEVYGKTLGVIGIGNIGMIVAEKAVALGMKVIVADPILDSRATDALGARLVGFEEVIRTSDFISIHSPRTEQTKGMFNVKTFSEMKKGVCLVNCARGGIVVEKDLIEALDKGMVRGAAVDVYDKEPPADWSLAKHPKVIATPHIGASTGEAQVNVSVMIARQIGAYLTRGEVVNAVKG